MRKTPTQEWEQQKKNQEYRRQYLSHCPEKEYIEFIKLRVAEFFKIPMDELYSKSRQAHLLIPRNICVRLINDLTKINDEAMFFVNRDRTNWYNSKEKTIEFLKQPYYQNAYENLKRLCNDINFESYKIKKVLLPKAEVSHTWQTPLESNYDTYKASQNEA